MNAAGSVVYITNEDPNYDYSAALEFGARLVGVFPPGQVHLSPQVALNRARGAMRDMKPGDFLALAGDPVKIAICAQVAAEMLGRVKFLRWNRQTRTYIEIEVDFDTTAAAVPAAQL